MYLHLSGLIPAALYWQKWNTVFITMFSQVCTAVCLLPYNEPFICTEGAGPLHKVRRVVMPFSTVAQNGQLCLAMGNSSVTICNLAATICYLLDLESVAMFAVISKYCLI